MNLYTNRQLKPMLLTEAKEPFNSDKYLFEIKFDGIRALIFVSPKDIHIYSRNSQDITFLFPELQAIKDIVSTDTIFDGEIVFVDNHNFSFSHIQSRLHLKDKTKIMRASLLEPVTFMAFDIIYHNQDLTTMPLLQRKEILLSFTDNDVFVKNHYVINKGLAFFQQIKNMHLEGMVAKKLDSLYYPNTRSDVWIKIKNIETAKFLVVGYIVNKNETLSLILGEKSQNKLYYVGKVTLQKSSSFYNIVRNSSWQKESPLVDYAQEAHYLTQKYSCYISYLERTDNNHLRHPQFICQC